MNLIVSLMVGKWEHKTAQAIRDKGLRIIGNNTNKG